MARHRLGPTTINGLYGTLVIKADGSYTYELNNASAAGRQPAERRRPARTPSTTWPGHGRLDVAQQAGHHHQRQHRRAAGGDHPVAGRATTCRCRKARRPATQGFTISSAGGVASTLGFTKRTARQARLTLTLAQLPEALSASSTQTIKTDKGELVLNGFDATTGW